jgi:hypothetical protein
MKNSKIWETKNRKREERMIPSMELNIILERGRVLLPTLKWVEESLEFSLFFIFFEAV